MSTPASGRQAWQTRQRRGLHGSCRHGPSPQTAEITSFAPAGVQADNYSFTYTAGDLVVKKEPEIKRSAGAACVACGAQAARGTDAYILGGAYVVPKALEVKIRSILGA